MPEWHHSHTFRGILLLLVLLLLCDCTTGDDDDDDNDVAAVDDDSTADDDGAPVEGALEWVSIPGGVFDMGCTPNDPDCFDDELPRHEVKMSSFFMTATETTQDQYQDVMGGNPSYFTGCNNCPVEQVFWNEAEAFCEAVGGRLPTEAQWEYAARAGAETRYSCGGGADCLDAVAWRLSDSGMTTHPVGAKSPNDFGLYDMHGNVWEWTLDWYDSEFFIGSPYANPVGPDEGTEIVLRGGAWNNEASWLRVSFRNHDEPDDRSAAAGFRCVKSSDE